MPKRSSKMAPRDVELFSAGIVGEPASDEPGALEQEAGWKNPHAVALGRLGGLKGGRARAIKLTAEQRQDIARRAAAARWHKGDRAW